MKFLSSVVLLSLAGFTSGQVCGDPSVLGYRCSQTQGGLTLHWGMLPDGSAINFHLEVAEGTGWFGVGWNSLNQMIGSTVVVADKSANVNQYNLVSKVDTEIQATKTDVATVQTLANPTPTVTTTNGKTVLTFTRVRGTSEVFRYSYIVMALQATTETPLTKHSEKYIFYVDFLRSLIVLSPQTNAPAIAGSAKVTVPAGDQHFTSSVVVTGLTATSRSYLFTNAYVNSMHATLGDTETGNDLISCLKVCTATQVAEWVDDTAAGSCVVCPVAPASRGIAPLLNTGRRMYFQGRSKKTAEELAAAHSTAVTAATAAAIAGGEAAIVVSTHTSNSAIETPEPPPVIVYPSVPMDYDDDDDTNGTAGIATAGSLSALIVFGLIYLAVRPKPGDKEEEEEASASSDAESSSEKA